MQYLFQSVNFRSDPSSKPYTDLLQDVGTEEISQVDLIGTNIGRLLDGSRYTKVRSSTPSINGAQRRTSSKDPTGQQQFHHYLAAAQGRADGGRRRYPWPSNDGTDLSTALMPDLVPITIVPARREEFSPRLDP